jgi:uncharacterized protein with beta-barrel porin domain
MGKGIENRTTRKLLLGSASALAIGFAFTHGATAAPCGSGSGITIAAACTGPFNWTGGNLTIAGAGTITAASTAGIGILGGNTVGTLSNSGSISITTGAAAALHNLGTLASIANSGGIRGHIVGIDNGGSIGTITNAGTIQGHLQNTATIGALYNNLGAATDDIYNTGQITLLRNDGLIDKGGLYSEGTIATLINNGTIRSNSATAAITNGGVIGTLTNNGLITGPMAAMANYNGTIELVNNGQMTGQIGLWNTGSILLTNAGTLAGDINNTGTLTISGGSGGTIGTLTGYNGSIGAFTGSALIFDTGDLLINDTINNGVTVVGTGGNLTNTGTLGTIAGLIVQSSASLASFNNSGEITAGSGALVNNGLIGTVTNSGLLSAQDAGIGNAGTIVAIVNTGSIMSTGGGGFSAGILNFGGSIGSIDNRGLISTLSALPAIANGGTIGKLTNSGTIQNLSGSAAIDVGTMGTLNNSGTIIGGTYGLAAAVANNDTLTLLTNSGTITGVNGGGAIYNSNSIGAIVNTGLINATDSGTGTGIYNQVGANIGTLTNSGLIENFNGIRNAFAITTLTNNGTIRSGGSAIYNQGSIGTLTNNGLIDGAQGVTNDSTITSLINNGTIQGASVALSNSFTIGTLTNNGLISSPGVAFVNGNYGSLVNNGIIAGSILTGSVLTISGGSNGTVGTLTGVNGGLGEVNGTLYFDTGALLLHDVLHNPLVVVGQGGLLTNTGSFASQLSIASGGTLAQFSNEATMSVGSSRAAIYDSGRIDKIDNKANATITGRTGIGVAARASIGTITNSGTISGSYGIRQLGGSIDTFDNRGSVSATSSAVYNGTGATISTIVNSGTLTGTATGISSNGAIGTIENHGSMSFDRAIVSAASITSISNSGTIIGNGAHGIGISISGGSTVSSITNLAGGLIEGTTSGTTAETGSGIISYGTLNSLTNFGTIRGSAAGIYQRGIGTQIDSLVNAGTISGGTGVSNVFSSIGVLTNTGLITGVVGLSNGRSDNAHIGTLSTLVNEGTISGTDYAINNFTTIGEVRNSGLISGNINTRERLTVTGGSGTVFGTLSGGTITGNIGLNGGNTRFADAVQGTLAINGGIVEIASHVSITGSLTQSGGVLDLLSGGELIVAGDAHLSSGLIVVEGLSATGNYTAGDQLTLIAADDTSDYSGVSIQLSIPGVSATTTIANGDLIAIFGNDYIGGTLASTTLTGNMGGGDYGYFIGGTGSIGSLTNNGTLNGNEFAFFNSGTIGDFVNNGNIVDGTGLANAGSIGALTNNAVISGGNGLANFGTIGALTNAASGVISGTTQAGIYNTGLIGQLTNSGTIASGPAGGVYNLAIIGTITNSGTITGPAGTDTGALRNEGTITLVSNSGTIGGTAWAGITNVGSIGALDNSGMIAGAAYAIGNAGSIGLITNSGTIAGNIRSTTTLAIAGGAGATYGVLSGGTITADVAFTAGNLRLADAVVGQVSNSGAQLQLGSSLTITGAYSQTAGTLELGFNKLTVSGKASISGGTVSASLPSAANYLVGQSITLIDAAAGSSYAGATVSLTPITGLAASATTASTEDLAITFGNDYVGGSLASLNNTGTISGAAYGIYIASTGTLTALANSGTIRGTQYALYSAGSLGTITNTGLISGNIRSAGQLVLAGTGGTLSGGTITATGVSIAGSLRLADAINVGSGTVSAGTASVELPSKISITGNYLQTGGVLISDVTDTATYGALAVSGSATITNTTITLNGSNLRAGQTYTIVDASAASSYTGDTLQISGAGHYRLKLSTVGDDLLALIRPMFGEVGAARGGSAAVIGGVLDRIADNNGLPTVVDRLSALSDDDLGRALEQVAPAEVGSGAASLQRASLIDDLIGGAVGQRANHGSAGWTLWAQVLGGTAQRDAVSGAAGYDTSAAGLVIGADTLLRDDLLVGAALSWSAGWNRSGIDTANNSNGVNSAQLTGYVSWARDAMTVNGRLGIGLNSYDQRRKMTYLDETARGAYSGRQYTMSVDAGYRVPLAWDVSLTPTVSLRWLRLATGGYSETGTGTDGLTIASLSADQVESGLGAKLAWTTETALGVVVPEISASWLHDFISSPDDTNAILGGISFKTSSARISANAIRIGAGLSLYGRDGISLSVGYNGQFRSDYAAHGGMLQLDLNL